MKLILTTVNQKSQAEKIAQALLKDQLAACVNFFPCSSRYRWQRRTCAAVAGSGPVRNDGTSCFSENLGNIVIPAAIPRNLDS